MARPIIYVNVEHGAVTEVHVPPTLKDTVSVIVRDYDTEGAPPEALDVDEDGRHYLDATP